MRRNLSNSEVRLLLSAVSLRSPFGRRDHLLIIFLYQTGLRVGELSRLLVQHVSRQGRPVHSLDLPASLCKGRRGRVVPLNATAQACVEKMLEFNRSLGLSVAPAAPLFQNSNRCPLSVRSIQKLIQGYRIESGIDIAATPHTLRHTNASALQDSGVPSRAIQAGLGHRRLSTTENYLAKNTKHLSKHYKALGG